MSFFLKTPARKFEQPPNDHDGVAAAVTNDRIYSELVAQRPALLDQKLKLHELIIDEFNLSLLDKMPPDELFKTVLSYVGDYLRQEKISLNQKELQFFAE